MLAGVFKSPAKWGSTIGIVLIGVGCYLFRFAAPVERLSYDLPFAFTRATAPPDVVMVNIDEESARALKQSPDQAWDRALHVKLLERLTRDQAALVFYDIIFATPGSNPAVDQSFADAMRKNGHVILSGAIEAESQGGVYS